MMTPSKGFKRVNVGVSVGLGVLLTLACAGAQATPIQFTDIRNTSIALADAGPLSIGPVSNSAPGDTPVDAAADVRSAGDDSASAVAFADRLRLVATSEARGVSTSAAASALAGFHGRFEVPAGSLGLRLDYDSVLMALASGLATTVLAVTLEVNGISLFDGTLFASQMIDRRWDIGAGGSGILDLSLIATADAFTNDEAFALASVSAALDSPGVAPVPTPSSTALFLVGMLGLAWSRKYWAQRHATGQV